MILILISTNTNELNLKYAIWPINKQCMYNRYYDGILYFETDV